VTTRPVGLDDLPAVAKLFESQRNTRRCWCMAFCTTRSQFARGWLRGGNERRFEAMAATEPSPMGVLAHRGDEAIGWCACGPRARYLFPGSTANKIIDSRISLDDETVWFLPCVFIHPDHRGEGLTPILVQAAVELARSEGASVVESWPLARSVGRSADAFLGREQVFEELGFRCAYRPSPERVIMRLELDSA
jgi:GNAT superfamily N-acetyltransferase